MNQIGDISTRKSKRQLYIKAYIHNFPAPRLCSEKYAAYVEIVISSY